MKIALIGYGKMGKMIEQIARDRGHEIVSIIDIDNQQDFDSPAFASADVAIEFTAPQVAYGNYLKAWAKGVKVVISTRATPEASAAAFAPLLVENVSLYREVSLFYGCPRWDSWRRACMANDIARANAVAVAGSGQGVKSALLAGMASMAVMKDRVAHQDYTGASIIANDLSAASAKKLLAYLRA